MQDKKRVKILDTDFNEELNLIQWKIQILENNSQIVLAWRGGDLGQALGIDTVISPDEMRKFCKDIKGKEINLVIKADNIPFDKKTLEDLTPEQIQDMSNKIEQEYPYYEIEYLEKGGGEKDEKKDGKK